MAIPIPPMDFSSMAASSAGSYQAPVVFGRYTASPIIGSGNDPVGGGAVGSGLPLWVWSAALVSAYLLAKKKGAK